MLGDISASDVKGGLRVDPGSPLLKDGKRAFLLINLLANSSGGGLLLLDNGILDRLLLGIAKK
jgi:hypothetical protein